MSAKKSNLVKLFFVAIGIALFSLTPKLPNWRWMSQKDTPYFSMFDTGLPIFRPWLPIEALEWRITGQNLLADNLVYGVLGGLVLYFLYKNIGERIFVYILTTLPLAIGIWYTANGGTLYDITCIFSLVFLLVVIRRISPQISIAKLIGVGVLMAMLDLSRPFAFNICILIFFYLLLKIKIKALIPLYVFVVLSAPFHITQLIKFNTFELSTYGGNNLVEAFNGSYAYAEDCYWLEAEKKLDTLEAAECAAANKKFILNSYLQNPKLLNKTINLERLKKVIFPELVWHATGLNPKDPLQINIKLAFHAGLLITYFLSLLALTKKAELPYKILLFSIACYVVLITLLANWLSEVLRVMLPAMAPLALLAQTYFNANKSKEA